MRSIVIVVFFFLSLATNASYPLDAAGHSPFAVAAQVHDLIGEPIDFDKKQHEFKVIVVLGNSPAPVVLPFDQFRNRQTVAPWQDKPPLFKLHGVFRI